MLIRRGRTGWSALFSHAEKKIDFLVANLNKPKGKIH